MRVAKLKEDTTRVGVDAIEHCQSLEEYCEALKQATFACYEPGNQWGL